MVVARPCLWSVSEARAAGQVYTIGSLGGSVSGPLVIDKAVYNVSCQLGRRSNDLQTLLNTSGTGLQASGVAADSVQRFVGILQNARVPIGFSGLPTHRLGDQGPVFGAIDFTPPSSTSGSAHTPPFNRNWNKQNPTTPPLAFILIRSLPPKKKG